jgi:Aluminium activated malate transporter
MLTNIDLLVGGCLYKGFNRASATFTAGAIALGVHWIAHQSGKQFEPVILSGSLFLLGIKIHHFS